MAAALALPRHDAAALGGRIVLEDVELVLRLDDGRVLRREALVGLTLMLATPDGQASVRIDGLDEDTEMVGNPLPLYRMSVEDGATRVRRDLCQADAKGRLVGFAFPDEAGGFHFTCTSGAEGKCVLAGYHPWEHSDAVPMRDLHRACVHMFRADYGGDDHPTTRNGTLIHFFDRFSIQKPSWAPCMEFEAAWGPEGALCVSHPRIADNVSLEELAERYPRLRGRVGPRACDEDAMRSNALALILNQSTVSFRTPR
jgi:hypothetical protein